MTYNTHVHKAESKTASRSQGTFFAPVVQRQETSEAAPAPPAAAPSTPTTATFNCSPMPVTHADFVRHAAVQQFNPAGAFGITILSSNNVQIPQVALDGSRRVMGTATEANVFSIYLQSGQIFPDESGRTVPIPEGYYCDTDIVHYGIMGDGARKIREGELEHCSDFRLAFDNTLVRYNNEVNRLARSRRSFRDLTQAKTHLGGRLGTHPDDWERTFFDLSNRTRRRDTRLHHNPPLGAVVLHPSDRHCRRPLMRISARTFPEIGVHSSQQILGLP